MTPDYTKNRYSTRYYLLQYITIYSLYIITTNYVCISHSLLQIKFTLFGHAYYGL